MRDRSPRRGAALLLCSAALALAALVLIPGAFAAQPFGTYLGQFAEAAA
jgi:hypothetical protein